MPRSPKEPISRVSIRLPQSLRWDLQVLAKLDNRENETDYWRKVLRDHVQEAKVSGKLPLEVQQRLEAVVGGHQ